jgi:hypothetical protein
MPELSVLITFWCIRVEEIKKFLREKTLNKNFFKYNKGVSHYHFGAKAHSEMIVYTFLLPGKNEKRKIISLFSKAPTNLCPISKKY